MGLYKPIYHPMSKSNEIYTYAYNNTDCKIGINNILNVNFYIDQCGDHVIVINSKEIALRGDEWQKRVYFHHTGFHGGATWTLAWELHSKDPTMVVDRFS